MVSSDSTCSFSGKSPVENEKEEDRSSKEKRKCMKSPTFDSALVEDISLMKDKILEIERGGSPKTKKEIIRVFSIPKSAKKRKLKMYLQVIY